MTKRLLLTALCWLAPGWGWACGNDNEGDTADIVACDGSCSCEPETRTCSCQGGSTCLAECDGPCTLECEGNARCDIECPADCTVNCPGTAGCVASVGDDSSGVCNGTGDCEYFCEGDCSFDCPGASRCIVHCTEDADCEITSCGGPNGVTECEDNVLACRRDCAP